jgi:hypothetical protein|tara:strand:+ start:394 stop:669 length:276 start_codon:yes stop_codon:yes gene_type:complete
MAQLNAPFNPNKPTTPQKPNGIAHMTTTITGTDGLITTVKAERATMKADWAAWVADWKTKYKAGDSLPAAYDGTFTSVDGSTAINIDYADE